MKKLIRRKKWWFIAGIFILLILSGIFLFYQVINSPAMQARRYAEEKETIDTGIVKAFTEERFEEQNPGVSPTETILSMRTDPMGIFVVEYWWKAEEKQYHYGYQVWSDGEQCQMLQEGTNVTKGVLMGNSLYTQPLEFFGCSFHDDTGFTFDGFSLTTEYVLLKERIELTETATDPYVKEEKGTDGWEQSVTFSQVAVADYPEATGTVTYHFCEGQFENGTMEIEFPDYKSALQYAKEKAELLLPLQKDTSTEEQETSYSVQSIDERDASIQIQAKEDTSQKGIVTVAFQENKHH